MDKQRLQELAGIESKLLAEGSCGGYYSEEEEIPTTQIGNFQIEVVGTGRDSFGGNDVANVRVNGKTYRAFKQGMINIWAFPLRTQMSRDEAKQFDEFMNQSFEQLS